MDSTLEVLSQAKGANHVVGVSLHFEGQLHLFSFEDLPYFLAFEKAILEAYLVSKACLTFSIVREGLFASILKNSRGIVSTIDHSLKFLEKIINFSKART